MSEPSVRNKRTPRARHRRGATIIECALTLPVLLFILFAILDLGIATVRYNTLAEVARRIAREAAIHGALVPEDLRAWGAAEFQGTVADSSELVAKARNVTPTMDNSLVTVRVSWPDGDNGLRDRVEVEVAYEHQSLLPNLFPWGQFDLQAVATTRIVN